MLFPLLRRYREMRREIFTLFMGVALLGVARNDQSATADNEGKPIGFEENDGRRQLEVPEVVLQLKYDNGELNRIYLTQFRKDVKAWVPTVAARGSLCSDLCYAGLGGEVCGGICREMIPVGLKSALLGNNQTEVAFGEPRYGVCPTLCENQLGTPLCNCPTTAMEDNSDPSVNWGAVCLTFCHDGYLPSGCPACELPEQSNTSTHISRILDTFEGWEAWCNIQCAQGQGGPACKCARSPF